MSIPSTAEPAIIKQVDRVDRYASAASVAGPRLPQTIMARATEGRPTDIREALRSVGGVAINQNISLEKVAARAELRVEDLRRALCDPEFEIPRGFISKIKGYLAETFREIEATPFVETEISKIVTDVLEHAAAENLLALVIGDNRTGKSEPAKRWVKLNPSRAIYIHCPDGDKSMFMRTLAKPLGIGVSTAVKATQLEWKIKQAAAEWKGVFVIDEAWRLWNDEAKHRPSRIEFIRDLVEPEVGASTVLISTDQFSDAQAKAEAESKGWGVGQWIGRIGRREDLPRDVSDKDLQAIIEVHFPTVSTRAHQAVFTLARSSKGLLGTVHNTAKMARYLAGKETVSTSHVFAATKKMISTDRTLAAMMKGDK